jgi:trehalose-phosphatase
VSAGSSSSNGSSISSDSRAGSLEPISVARAVELAVAHLARRPLLVVSDFDGTLSQIVQDPWGASILPLGQAALRRLAGVDGVHVVVLSGRTAADVAARVRVGNVTYLGNHGIERGFVPRGRRPEQVAWASDPAAHAAGHLAEQLADEVPLLVREPWLVVERKPPAVSFHFRGAPDVAAAATRVAQAVEQLDPDRALERFPGRRVLELRPLGAVAKGEAVAGLIEEFTPRGVFLLGDDVSDALAFVELRRAREAGRTDGIAVAVRARDEVPSEVLAAADIVLESPRAATRFLSALARRLAAG